MDTVYHDDDTHICLKCRTTIMGLENYVAHRKSGCFAASRFRPVRPPGDVIHSARPETISPIENNDPCLKADAFFSLLELQSSSKKQDFSSRNPSGVVTRSKTSATQTKPEPVLGALVVLAEEDEDEMDELKHAGCPPSKDVGGKWKPSVIGESPTPWTTPLLDEEREFSWEFSAQDQTSENLRWDSQIPSHRFRLHSPSPVAQTKKVPKSDACRSPMISGAQWKPQYQVHEPPPVTVGGKWKPEDMTEERKNEEVRSEERKNEELGSQEQKNEEMRSDEESEQHPMRRSIMAPPPGHTRGKWAPGMEARVREAMGLAGADNNGVMPSPARKSGSTVQYWCAPCRRRLSSRSLYERHLLSELHFKRTLPQPGQVDAPDRKEQQRARRPKPTQKVLEQQSTSSKAAPVQENAKPRAHEQCVVCSARVLRHQIGKHLVSHYHWRGIQRGMARASSKQAADALRKTADRMVLDNIHAIVKLAPFQCGVCRFYCNTTDSFREHWTSKMHANNESQGDGDFWCWPCDITQATSTDLLTHLTSPEHLEVEAALNRTLPVIIRRRRDLQCVHPSCGRHFRLNIQLRHHQKAQGHIHQLRCGSCGAAKKNHLQLQKHVLRTHPVDAGDGGPVFCARTQRLFPCAAAAVSAEQQEIIARTAPKPRRCPHCDIILLSVNALRIHLEKRHPDLRVRCARCNASFALPQQVTRHVRDGQCSEHLSRRQPPHTPGTAPPPQAPVQVDTNQPKSLACATCPYRSDSKAELLYHQLLHRETVDTTPLSCPVDNCGKSFQRITSLQGHIRTHTGERPFKCTSCPSAFTRRYSLAAHRRRVHQAPDSEWTDWRTARVILDPETTTDASSSASDAQLCAVCGKCLRDRTTLRQHMGIHNVRCFECDEPECSYRATSAAKLKRHQCIHSSERPFACAHCAFATKSQSQLQRHLTVHTGSRPHTCPHCPFSSRLPLHLKRHMRVHTGDKPYKCPHCPYRCNVMENLRKHVLTTKRHADKKLYCCHECIDFSTNSAKEIQTHLTTVHASKFSTFAEASAYIVASVYQAESETPKKDVPIPSSSHVLGPHSREFPKRSKVPKPLKDAPELTNDDPKPLNEAPESRNDDDPKPLTDASEHLNDDPEPLHDAPEPLNEILEPVGEDLEFVSEDADPFEVVTHTIGHEETVNNVLTIEQAMGRRVVLTCPDGQLMSVIVLPSD